jgi:hypothetical protein
MDKRPHNVFAVYPQDSVHDTRLAQFSSTYNTHHTPLITVDYSLIDCDTLFNVINTRLNGRPITITSPDGKKHAINVSNGHTVVDLMDLEPQMTPRGDTVHQYDTHTLPPWAVPLLNAHTQFKHVSFIPLTKALNLVIGSDGAGVHTIVNNDFIMQKVISTKRDAYTLKLIWAFTSDNSIHVYPVHGDSSPYTLHTPLPLPTVTKPWWFTTGTTNTTNVLLGNIHMAYSLDVLDMRTTDKCIMIDVE